MTIDELKEKIRLHGMWAKGDPAGQRAYLRGVYLQRAYLRGVYLQGAYLQGADLRGAKNFDIATIIHTRSIVPEVGVFTGFKQARTDDGRVIVCLEVPATAKRLGGLLGRKCRVSEAVVMSMTHPDGTPYEGEASSLRDSKFKYAMGLVVEVAGFCEDVTEECAAGIHLFLTRQEAVEYS